MYMPSEVSSLLCAAVEVLDMRLKLSVPMPFVVMHQRYRNMANRQNQQPKDRFEKSEMWHEDHLIDSKETTKCFNRPRLKRRRQSQLSCGR
jgi:hypothetical protein